MFHNWPARLVPILGALLFVACPATMAIAQQTSGSDILPALPSGKAWKLIWSDEFDGAAIDQTKWYTPGNYVVRSSGAWSDSALKVGGGVLEFPILVENGVLVTSGLSSQNRFSATYGYWEIRAKLPTTPGYTPAFWLSSTRINNVGDPSHPTEIDIFEDPGRADYIRVNLNWNGYKQSAQTTGATVTVSHPEEFHTYGMWWTGSGYYFYVDGKQVWESKGGGVSTGPEFIRLGNEPLSVAPNPLPNFTDDGNFTVDYVRVYQAQ